MNRDMKLLIDALVTRAIRSGEDGPLLDTFTPFGSSDIEYDILRDVLGVEFDDKASQYSDTNDDYSADKRGYARSLWLLVGRHVRERYTNLTTDE